MLVCYVWIFWWNGQIEKIAWKSLLSSVELKQYLEICLAPVINFIDASSLTLNWLGIHLWQKFTMERFFPLPLILSTLSYISEGYGQTGDDNLSRDLKILDFDVLLNLINTCLREVCGMASESTSKLICLFAWKIGFECWRPLIHSWL